MLQTKLDRLEGFGVAFYTNRGLREGDWLSLGRLAEDKGFSSVWTTEDSGREAFAFLGSLAVQTRRVLLGPAVVNTYSRSAPLIAQACATLEDVSDGRAVLGIGTGNPASMRRWHSPTLGRPAVRLRDYIGIIKTALLDEGDYLGEEVSAETLSLPFDSDHPDVPIIVGGRSPSIVEVAAQVGDGWMPSGGPETIEQHRKEFSGNGVILAYVIAAASGDSQTALNVIRRQVAAYAATVPYLRRRYEEALDPELVQRVINHWRNNQRDESIELLPADFVRSLAVAGTRSECRSRVQDFIDAGADGVVFGLTGQATLHELRDSVAMLAP